MSNASSWLPGLLGPLTLQVNGVAVDIPKRATVNIVAPGATVADDDENDRTDVTVPVVATARKAVTSVGSINNLDYEGSAIVVFEPLTGGAITLTGLAGPSDNRTVAIYANGRDVTIAHDSGSSSLGNKIYTPTGADIVLADGDGCQLTYDAGLSRWFFSSGSSAGAGPDFGAAQVETTGIGLFGQIKTTVVVEAGAGPFNNYDPGDNSVVKFSNGASVNLTGIVAPSGGKSRVLFLIAPNGVACFGEDGASTAANRMRIGVLDGSSVKAQTLVYDTNSSRWQQMAYPIS